MSKLLRYPAVLKIGSPGSRPERDKKTTDGYYVLRKWQATLYNVCRKAMLRQINAPTASGKSIAMVAVAMKDLIDRRADKIVVAVPQSLVGAGFIKPIRLVLPTGERVHWLPEHQLLDTQDVIERIHKFLMTPLGVGRLDPERLLVCSHAALVAFHKKYGQDYKVYQKVAVFIDEAHHVCYGDDDEDAPNVQENELQNRLGAFVSGWIDKHRSLGPLTLTTATWFRSDRAAIIPPGKESKFCRYTLTMIEFLKTHMHLKDIEIRYLTPDPGRTVEDCVKKIYDEDPRANTLVYLQPQNQLQHDKLTRLATLRKKLRLKPNEFVDLVTEDGRTEVKSEFVGGIRDGEYDLALNGHRKKTWIFALQLGREGFDMPSLQRSIIIGVRKSQQVMCQMLGRLLRDHPGKTTVQFNVIMPFTNKDAVNGERVQAHMKAMIAMLALGAILDPPKFTKDEQKAFAKLTEDGPDKLGDILNTVRRAMPGSKITDPIGFIKEALELAGHETDPVLTSVIHKLLKQQTNRVKRDRKERQQDLLAKLPDQDIVYDDFDGIRTWTLTPFGYESLEAFNQAVGNWPEFTWEDADAAIFAYGQ